MKTVTLIFIFWLLLGSKTNAQFFEGIITYKFEVLNNSSIPDSIFRIMFNDADTEEKLFYSNGNYKTITNIGRSVTLLNLNENGLVYSYIDKTKTASKYDGTKKTDFDYELINEDETYTILGIPCKKIIYKTISKSGLTAEYQMYYSEQLKVDKSKFKSFTIGYLEFMFKEFGTIPLKIVFTGTGCLHYISLTATKIDKIEINPKTFKVPKFKHFFNFPTL